MFRLETHMIIGSIVVANPSCPRGMERRTIFIAKVKVKGGKLNCSKLPRWKRCMKLGNT